MHGRGVLQGAGGLEAPNCGGPGYGKGVELGCEEPGGVAWNRGILMKVRAMVAGLWAWVGLHWEGWGYGRQMELY